MKEYTDTKIISGTIKRKYIQDYLDENRKLIVDCAGNHQKSKTVKREQDNELTYDFLFNILCLEIKAFCLSFDKNSNGCKIVLNNQRKRLMEVRFNDRLYYYSVDGFELSKFTEEFKKIVQYKREKINNSARIAKCHLLSTLLYVFSIDKKYKLPESPKSPDDLCEKMYGFSKYIIPEDGLKYENLINDENKCKAYLFGIQKKTEVDVMRDARRNWYGENIDFEDVYLASDAKKIILKARQYPIYRFLFDDLNEHQNEIRIFLSKSVIKSGNEIIVKSPTQSLLDWLDNIIKEYLKCRMLTYYDVVCKLGELAEKITKNVLDNKSDNNDFSFDSVGFDDIKDIELIKITADGKIKFKNKQYRLLCLAMFNAYDFNLKYNIAEIKDCMWKFLPFENAEFVNRNLKNVLIGDREYNDFLIFSTALVMQLDNRVRVKLIYNLCNNEAVNFDVQTLFKGVNPENRIKQIGSIYLLTNLLIENVPISTYELREKMFLSTYGRAMYTLQAEHFDALCDSSNFYLMELQRVVDMVFEMEEYPIDGKHILKCKNQPYYFFLYGYLYNNDKIPVIMKNDIDYLKIFKNASVMHYLSWCSSNENNKKRDFILKLINNIIDGMSSIYTILKRTSEEYEEADFQHKKIYGTSKYKLALSGQFLCYALANLINYDNGIMFSEYLQSVEDTEKCYKTILGIAVYCDYYTRKFNSVYDNETNTNTVDNHVDLYLLCGPSRIISAIDYIKNGKKPLENLFIFDPTILITLDMCKDYKKWHNWEYEKRDSNFRYEILLLKILSKVYYKSENSKQIENQNFVFDKKIEDAREKHGKEHCQFLPYDYMI